MASRQSLSHEDTQFRVLRLIEQNPKVTQRELADHLGVSVGRLHYCLKALMVRGWVKMHNFQTNKNKFGYAYFLTPEGFAQKAAMTGRFLQRQMAEYDALRAEIEALRSENSGAPTGSLPASGTTAK